MSAPITGKSRKLAEKLISQRETGAQKRISLRKEEIRKNAEGFAASNPTAALIVVLGIPTLCLMGIVLSLQIISNVIDMRFAGTIFGIAVIALATLVTIGSFMDAMIRFTHKKEKRKVQ